MIREIESLVVTFQHETSCATVRANKPHKKDICDCKFKGNHLKEIREKVVWRPRP